MDGEIILDRGDSNVIKLDENEQALLDEIQLDFPNLKQCPEENPKLLVFNIDRSKKSTTKRILMNLRIQ